MNWIVFLILRRMRIPLALLCTTYTFSTLGMVLMPGVDNQGNPWHMDFFHAVYFITFMGSTIGFGEIPYAFSGAQRLWATLSIYLCVISWLYAIGVLLNLLQDESLRRAIVEARFARAVRRISEPFFLVCGYGDTGRALVDGLERYGIRSVVMDIQQRQIHQLEIRNYPVYVPALCADAGREEYLIAGGVKHSLCVGVIAITSENRTNLRIAMTSKLLNPPLQVICRADSREVEAHMRVFATDHVIDPFNTFGEHLATCLNSPDQYLLHQWLTGLAHAPLAQPIYPPRGLWILCGYGRFGKAVHRSLRGAAISVTTIEPHPEDAEAPEGTICGPGTDAEILVKAGIEKAAGIVAGTDDDIDNLLIVTTARELNPNVFVVARQTQLQHQSMFDAIRADFVMHASQVIATKIRGLLAAPMLEEFLQLSRGHDDRWASELLSRLSGLLRGKVPDVWRIKIGDRDAYAVDKALADGQTVQLEHLTRDPRRRDARLPCLALMLERAGEQQLLPAEQEPLQIDDRILFCGAVPSWSRMRWTLHNPAVLTYVLTGKTPPQTPAARWLSGVFNRSQ